MAIMSILYVICVQHGSICSIIYILCYILRMSLSSMIYGSMLYILCTEYVFVALWFYHPWIYDDIHPRSLGRWPNARGRSPYGTSAELPRPEACLVSPSPSSPPTPLPLLLSIYSDLSPISSKHHTTPSLHALHYPSVLSPAYPKTERRELQHHQLH
jgi:hypothetical protein